MSQAPPICGRGHRWAPPLTCDVIKGAGTHGRGVAEALQGLEDAAPDHPHGEGAAAVIHDAPGAAGRPYVNIGAWGPYVNTGGPYVNIGGPT